MRHLVAFAPAIQEVLAASHFKQTEVHVSSSQSMLTRYGDNKITQNVEQDKTSVSIRAVEGEKSGQFLEVT